MSNCSFFFHPPDAREKKSAEINIFLLLIGGILVIRMYAPLSAKCASFFHVWEWKYFVNIHKKMTNLEWNGLFPNMHLNHSEEQNKSNNSGFRFVWMELHSNIFINAFKGNNTKSCKYWHFKCIVFNRNGSGFYFYSIRNKQRLSSFLRNF